jgi:hypothetical protein
MSGGSFLPNRIAPEALLASRLAGTSKNGGRGASTKKISIPLGSPGRCPHHPTLLTLLFDNSGSVSGVAGNDPVAQRYVEAELAIEAVGRRCRCRQELVSIVHFDVPTSGDVLPTPISRGGWRTLRHGLSIPPDGAGASLLGPSLEAAYGIAERYPRHGHILVALTDFELFDNELPRVLDDFCAFPGTVHAVALRANPPTRLVDDDRVRVTHVVYTDQPGAVARAVFSALTTHRRSLAPTARTREGSRRN